MVYEKVVNLCYWQESTTPAFPYSHLLGYYNVVLLTKFLAMMKNSIYCEKKSIKNLVLPDKCNAEPNLF